MRGDAGQEQQRGAGRILYGLLIGAATIAFAAGSLAAGLAGGEPTEDADADPLPTRADRRAPEALGVATDRAERAKPADPAPAPAGSDPAPSAPANDYQPAPGTASRKLWSGRGHRVAWVREGETAGVYRRPGGRRIERVGSRTQFGSIRTFSVLDRRGQWLEVTTPITEDNQPLWIRANRRKLGFFKTPLSIRASLSGRRVELRRGRRVLESFAVTVGAAGTSTPPGRFAVTDLIVGGLSPVYGCCAIALSAHQPNLPEGWIGGNRVAIHGANGAIGEAASAGCIRARDRNVRSLIERIPLGTPVFIEA